MNKAWKRLLILMPKSFLGTNSFPKSIRKELCLPDKPRAMQEYDVKKPFGYTGI